MLWGWMVSLCFVLVAAVFPQTAQAAPNPGDCLQFNNQVVSPAGAADINPDLWDFCTKAPDKLCVQTSYSEPVRCDTAKINKLAIGLDPTKAQTEEECKSVNGTWSNGKCAAQGSLTGQQSSLCGIEGAMAWLACPVTTALTTFARFLNDILQRLLFLPTENIFGTNGPSSNPNSQGFYNAWKVFRNVGIALIVIAGLVMVVSHSMGLDIIDAYTIQKLMPRLVFALIGVVLSWPLLKFGITFFNDMGAWVRTIMLFPFNDIQSPINAAQSAGIAVFEWALIPAGVVGGVIGISFLGPLGVLSLIGSIALALLIGLVVLAVRQLVLIVCLLAAPMAIACYVLPGTQKVWSFWKKTFITSLAMFPVIMAFIAAGEIMARIAALGRTPGAYMLSLIVFYAPYFMLPFAFKMAGGLMATIFSISNDRSRGLFDRSRKLRQETSKRRMGEFAGGKRAFEGDSAFAKIGNRIVGGTARRSALASEGGLNMTKRGRSRYAFAKSKLTEATADEMLKNDNNFSSGDDDAMDIASRSTTQQAFLNEYANRYARTHGVGKDRALEAAQSALGKVEAGFGGPVGTEAMRKAAFKALHASNTSFVNKDGSTKWEGEGGINESAEAMMASGLYDATDIARIVKSNQTRADRSALGFGDLQNHFLGLDSRARGRTEGNVLSGAELEDRAFAGASANQITGGHTNTVKAFARIGERHLKESLSGAPAPAGSKFAGMSARDQVIMQAAAHAARVDMGGSISPEKAAIEAEVLQEVHQVETLDPEVKQMLAHVINGPALNPDGTIQRRATQNPVTGEVRYENVQGPSKTTLTTKEIYEGIRNTPVVRDSEFFTSLRREYGSPAQADAAARAQPPEEQK